LSISTARVVRWMAHGAGVFMCLLAGACSAKIPEGVFVCSVGDDCPQGFDCRADARGMHCYSSQGEDDRDQNPVGDGNLDELSDGGMPGGGGDRTEDASAGAGSPVFRLVRGHLGALGGARSSGPYRLHDEVLEGQTTCDDITNACVSGRIGP
jgi:hypothetical protein